MKKGGVYSRIQARRKIMEECGQCQNSTYVPPEEYFRFKEA
jgi:hypothetical protein